MTKEPNKKKNISMFKTKCSFECLLTLHDIFNNYLIAIFINNMMAVNSFTVVNDVV